MTPALRRVARLVVVAAGCLTSLLATGAPASAHGPTPDGTNYLSTVTGIAAAGGGGAGARPDGVTWRVLGGDALLQVRNTGDRRLIVLGYDGEPYLRVGRDGVFENRNSPAVYLNTDRFGMVTVPPDVDPRAAPDWRELTGAPQWQWHDHRIHWMSPTRPPKVRDDPDTAQQVLSWTVPFELGDRDLVVQGALRWIPPAAPWPWLAIAAAALSLPVVVPLLRGAGERRTTRVMVALTLLVGAAGVMVAVGDAVVTPASLAANLWAIAQTGGPALVAGALAWSLWRSAPDGDAARPATTLVIAALIIAVGGGVPRVSQLVSSQVNNALPPDVVKAVVAASLMLVVPALLVVVVRRPSLQVARAR